MTKDDLIRKYAEYKETYGAIPKRSDFVKFAGAHKRQLTAVFGRDAYSKLQRECGDDPNKLDLERTPLETIMRQYGDLALELGALPNSSDWIHRKVEAIALRVIADRLEEGKIAADLISMSCAAA